jgi:uncharacterized protein
VIFRLAVTIFLSVAFLPQLQAASFDCAKASTFAERTICSDPKLSELDEQMSLVYKKALESAADPQSLKDVQNWWRTGKRDACRDKRCIEEVYVQRIQELNAVLSFAAKSGTASEQRPMPRKDNLSVAREEPHSQPARVTSTKPTTSFVDGTGVAYNAAENEHGITLKSNDTTIYLGRSCDAHSPQHGEGKWGWSNDGVLVQLQKMNIQFPRQTSPFPDERCSLGEQRQAQASMSEPVQKGISQPKTVSEEKSFSMSGKIDNQQDIKATFKISGSQIAGSYFNVTEHLEAKLAGTIDERKNIVINEYDESGANIAFLVGKFSSDTTIEGYRTKPSQNKTQPFYLKMDEPVSAAADTQGPVQKFSPKGLDTGRSQTAQTSPNALQPHPASSDEQSTTVILVSSGVGATPEEAIKNALSNAVEQAVGLIVDAETIVKNEQIIRDQLLTYSNAYVGKYQELAREIKADGLVMVRIKAEVEKKVLAEKLAPMTVKAAPVEGKNLFAQAVTQVKEEKDAGAILRKLFQDFPGSVLEAKPYGQPRIISKTDSEVTVGVTVRFAVDPERYGQWVTASKAHLSKIALETHTQRWNPDQMGFEPLRHSLPTKPPQDNKEWEAITVPNDDLGRSFRPPSRFEWFSKAFDGKKVLVVVEKMGSSPATIFVLTEDLFSEAVGAALSIPMVSVTLQDASGKEVDGQEWVAFSKPEPGRDMFYSSPFWTLEDNQLISAPFLGYPLHESFRSDMKPAEDRILKFIRESKLIVTPYLGANKFPYNQRAIMLPAFCNECVFKLSPQELAKVDRVEVKVWSHNNFLGNKLATGS